jgi:hypothetical protein
VGVAWPHGTLISLRTPPALSAMPTGINDKGEVAGTVGAGAAALSAPAWVMVRA